MIAKQKIYRRDALKLIGAASAGISLARILPRMTDVAERSRPNIIIILFDAMSAHHLSLYGYGRDTTPNLLKFAERAIIYHSHYSAGSFTTSGTASLLTGVHPWTHRAINLGGLVRREWVNKSIFQWIGDEYNKIAFAQNVWADLFLHQFSENLDFHVPTTSFSFRTKTPLYSANMPKDTLMAHYAVDEFLALNYKELTPLPGSLTLGMASMINNEHNRELQQPTDKYPYGMPYNSLSYYYHNRDVFNGIGELITKQNSSKPLFAYFHLFSPHAPYASTREFTGKFDEIRVPYKPVHPLSYMRYKQKDLNKFRLHYDEYISNVDAEFGRLINMLDNAGLLKTSYIIVTSDHGEVFERGEVGHGTALLYSPVIHIPLLVSVPNQSRRTDIFLSTSSTDVVPTILKLAGRPIPSGLEGRVLPALGGTEEPNRSIFSVEAKESSAFFPLRVTTLSLIKNYYHLLYYKGYKKYSEVFELYHLADDPEERRNLYDIDSTQASSMKNELLEALVEADRPFVQNKAQK